VNEKKKHVKAHNRGNGEKEKYYNVFMAYDEWLRYIKI
jgi:hypothetical protein